MTKIEAQNNALALLHYALWRYSDMIISLTSNDVVYDVTIQFNRDRYDMEVEDERLRNIIAAGARIDKIEVTDRDYDIYSVSYMYKD